MALRLIDTFRFYDDRMKSGQSRWLIVLTGLLAATTACSSPSVSDAAPLASTAPTQSTSPPSPTPSPSPPALPRMASQHTMAGARTFAHHFWDVYNYSVRTLDTSEMRKISGSECSFCQTFMKNIESLKRKNRRTAGGLVAVSDVATKKLSASTQTDDLDIFKVYNVVRTDKQSIYSSEGNLVDSGPVYVEHLTVFVSWDSKSWSVFDVGDSNK
jgi:hypothetical protein